MRINSVTDLIKILSNNPTIAIVGLSPKKARPSYQVASYLLEAGFTVIPVNPGQNMILGQVCYPRLTDIPEPVDIVDIFRRSTYVEPIVRDAIGIGARVIWMQRGIINDQVSQQAEEAGLLVIMDRCIKIDHMELIGSTGI